MKSSYPNKLATKTEPTFISTGFRNYKKSTEKFTAHEKSQTHKFSVAQLSSQKRPTVMSQLNSNDLQQHNDNRECLLKVISKVRILLRQGIATRGHLEHEGNLMQVLKADAEYDKSMENWLKRKSNYLSHECMAEIKDIFAHTIIRELCFEIREKSGIFGIIVDGTQDINGTDQE